MSATKKRRQKAKMAWDENRPPKSSSPVREQTTTSKKTTGSKKEYLDTKAAGPSFWSHCETTDSVDPEFDRDDTKLRGITTLLRLLDCTSDEAAHQNIQPSTEREKEIVRELNGLALCFVRSHETVAVMPRRTCANHLYANIVAAEFYDAIVTTEMNPPAEENPKSLHNIFVSKNPGEEETEGKGVSIVSGKETMELSDYLSEWRRQRDRGKWAHHVQVVAAFLNKELAEGPNSGLHEYVIISSASKLCRRLHRRFGEIFSNVDVSDFPGRYIRPMIIQGPELCAVARCLTSLPEQIQNMFPCLQNFYNSNYRRMHSNKDLDPLPLAGYKEIVGLAKAIIERMREETSRLVLLKQRDELDPSHTEEINKTVKALRLIMSSGAAMFNTDLLVGIFEPMVEPQFIRMNEEKKLRIQKDASSAFNKKVKKKKPGYLHKKIANLQHDLEKAPTQAIKEKLQVQIQNFQKELGDLSKENELPQVEFASKKMGPGDRASSNNEEQGCREDVDMRENTAIEEEDEDEMETFSCQSVALRWARSCVASIHFMDHMRTVGFPNAITFDMIEYLSPTPGILVPWASTVEEILSGKSVEIIEKLVAQDRVEHVLSEMSRLAIGKFQSKQPIAFRGRAHCEATCAVAIHLASKEGPNMNLGGSMPSKFNLKTMYLGVSKKSCPVCVEILSAIACQLDLDMFIGGKHRKYFPCAFPPATPEAVRRQVINSLAWKLEKTLLKLTEDRPRRPSSLMSQSFSMDVDGIFGAPPPFNPSGVAIGVGSGGDKDTGESTKAMYSSDEQEG